MAAKIPVRFHCPYASCVWPSCRRTPDGWTKRPACRDAEAAAIHEQVTRRIDARPNIKAARVRCGAKGPETFQRCGRWKGHDGDHREMCAIAGWPSGVEA